MKLVKERVVISFLTQNRHKFIEAKEALMPYKCIQIVQLSEGKHEYKDDSVNDPIKQIALKAAEEGANLYKKMVVTEDTGLFFNAYRDFPSLNTKWVIKQLDYDGILRLLDGKDRTAYFRSVVALCKPNEEPIAFDGRIDGHIAEKVYGENIDCMDYDRVFIPDDSDVPFSLMMDNKAHISHRKIAFQKLGEYISKQLDNE
jgi:XTP/dITP diphosphohydrolase